MASPTLSATQSTGGRQERPSPTLQPSQDRLTSINSNTSSDSSVLPTVFSEPSRSRSHTPPSNASSGDDIDAQKRQKPAERSRQRPRSTSSNSISPGLSPRPFHAQATKSGHRLSQQLEPIPQGEDLELHELTSDQPPQRLPAPTSQPGQRRSSEHGDAGSIAPLRNRNDTDDSIAAPSRTESWWSNPREWQPRRWPSRSVYYVHESISTRVMYGFFTLIVGLFAAASAAYFAYRTYLMQLWQSEHDYFDWCRQAMADFPTKECKDLLETELPPPPFQYSRAHALPKLSSRSLTAPIPRARTSVWTVESVFMILLITVSLLVFQITLAPISHDLWERLAKYRSLIRSTQRMPWYMRQQTTDPFALANVRIEPQLRRTQEPNKEQGDGGLSKAMPYRRIMPVLEHLREKALQAKDQQEDGESVYEIPLWKTKDLGDLMPDDRSGLPEKAMADSDNEIECIPVPTQIGNALKGTTDDDKMVQPLKRTDSNTMQNIRRKLKSKRPRLFSMSSRADSWDDVQPPFTALGADEDGDEKAAQGRRQNVVLSGHVAVGLAQAGAALASSAGGAIGKNILVQLVEKESERLHNMLQSGLSRIQTNEDLDYDHQKDDFVQGRKSPQQLRRRTRTKSSAAS